MEVYKMEKAIAYVRQSTLKQQSLATQKSLIIDTAKQHGWSNVTFYDDKKQVDIQSVQAIKNGRSDYIWRV